MASPRRRPTAADVKWALVAEIDRLRGENARLAAENEKLRAALERIDYLTPNRANAATAYDLHLTTRAIIHAALTGGKDGE